jgi:rhamnulokinase
MILPDLLGYLLGGGENHELTQASTTNLLGLDGRWCEEAFAVAGWPVPELPPSLAGTLGPQIAPSVRLARVGSHDTASAVVGFGRLEEDEAFLNVGTWSLVGCVLPEPLATPEAEAANFTNERAAHGRVRFLRNVPGFWVINRLHEELGVAEPVPQWLERAATVEARLDLFHPDLFSPPSMLAACRALTSREPRNPQEWAGIALASLADAIAAQPAEMARLTGRTFSAFRVGGGGSQSAALCQALADTSGLEVRAGPAEATVVGNLAVGLLASGALGSWEEMETVVRRSAEVEVYRPNASHT